MATSSASATVTPLLSQADVDAICTGHERLLSGKSGGAHAMFAWLDLSGLDLGGRNLREADFTGASLSDCRFVGANLERTNFYGADLQRADLTEAMLVRADLRGACLRGANLTHADVTGLDSSRLIIDDTTKGFAPAR